MAKALLVIDLQDDYIQKYPPLFLACINERLQRATADKELIVYVKNTKKLRSGAKTTALVKNLNICSEYIICKETASAFSNPELLESLVNPYIVRL